MVGFGLNGDVFNREKWLSWKVLDPALFCCYARWLCMNYIMTVLLLVSCISTKNHLLYFVRFCAGSTPKIANKIIQQRTFPGFITISSINDDWGKLQSIAFYFRCSFWAKKLICVSKKLICVARCLYGLFWIVIPNHISLQVNRGLEVINRYCETVFLGLTDDALSCCSFIVVCTSFKMKFSKFNNWSFSVT